MKSKAELHAERLRSVESVVAQVIWNAKADEWSGAVRNVRELEVCI